MKNTKLHTISGGGGGEEVLTLFAMQAAEHETKDTRFPLQTTG